MDHAEASEILEIAAVEPGGLERLGAGDTAEAAALAGHLVGCADCAAELGRLRRIERLLRGTVSEMPPPELRERTLEFVRAVGRDRSAAATAATTATGRAGSDDGALLAVPEAPRAEPTPIDAGRRKRTGSRPGTMAGWLLATAAAVALAVAGTASIVGGSRNADVSRAQAAAGELASVSAATIQVAAAPDARRVVLSNPNGAARGQLVFAASLGQMVVTATGLPDATGTWSYRCWSVQNGQKRVLGWMHLENGLAYWVGPVQDLAGLTSSGTQFGVSLVDESAGTSDVVLTGSI